MCISPKMSRFFLMGQMFVLAVKGKTLISSTKQIEINFIFIWSKSFGILIFQLLNRQTANFHGNSHMLMNNNEKCEYSEFISKF